MLSNVVVEIGRAKKSGNEIIVELGRSNIPAEQRNDWKEGFIIELDKEAHLPLDVLVNGRLATKGFIMFDEKYFCVKIMEALDGGANFEAGEIVKLDKETGFASEINNIQPFDFREKLSADIFTDGKLAAKGSVKIIKGNFGVQIEEIL